jgi:hypothetical protein
LEQVKDSNKWIGIGVAGLGVVGLVGAAIWVLRKPFKKEEENEEGKEEAVMEKGRLHPREWTVMLDDATNEEDFDEHNHDF